ncbi:hypothetical protein ACB098_05G070200 [Castanea mollissima]|uniref:Uncharacterized protein n=1 Tax=Castanea mollissima TaxID=60419 RepID=A0A8J4VP91_9ROSI|nr:hypothetical protein CMV_011328 [Castanea mollissima]
MSMLISRNCDRWRACTLSGGRRTCCGAHRDSACRLYATWKEGCLQILRHCICMHTLWALSKISIAPSLWRIDTVKSFGRSSQFRNSFFFRPLFLFLFLFLFRVVLEGFLGFGQFNLGVSSEN